MNAADLLQKSLDEEKATNEKLTELAESAINVQAAEPPMSTRDVIRQCSRII